MRPGTTTASFSVASGDQVEVIGENRTLTITSGKFTDNFASYGVHLYKITKAANAVEEHGKYNVLMLYPNPVNDDLFIEWKGVQKKMHYRIFDISGRMVMNGMLIGNSIALTTLDKGSYVILFQDEAGSREVHHFLKD